MVHSGVCGNKHTELQLNLMQMYTCHRLQVFPVGPPSRVQIKSDGNQKFESDGQDGAAAAPAPSPALGRMNPVDRAACAPCLSRAACNEAVLLMVVAGKCDMKKGR